MNQLVYHDFQFALRRCPKQLLRVMKTPEWAGKIFVGGGFLRSIVAGDPVNDVDVFVSTKEDAEKLAVKLVAEQLSRDGTILSRVNPGDGSGLVTGDYLLTEDDHVAIQKRIQRTDNALTLFCMNPPVQIIHRWVFNSATDVANSFDFTCCCAAFVWTGDGWKSYCDERFYPDVAAKRLIYRSPVRNEDAGGSMLRVLKYYQKGYRIPLDSLGAVIARLMQGMHPETVLGTEANLAAVVTGLLREVDPLIDPSHLAHLPAESVNDPVPVET